jgi:hypothetical protein
VVVVGSETIVSWELSVLIHDMAPFIVEDFKGLGASERQTGHNCVLSFGRGADNLTGAIILVGERVVVRCAAVHATTYFIPAWAIVWVGTNVVVHGIAISASKHQIRAWSIISVGSNAVVHGTSVHAPRDSENAWAIIGVCVAVVVKGSGGNAPVDHNFAWTIFSVGESVEVGSCWVHAPQNEVGTWAIINGCASFVVDCSGWHASTDICNAGATWRVYTRPEESAYHADIVFSMGLGKLKGRKDCEGDLLHLK